MFHHSKSKHLNFLAVHKAMNELANLVPRVKRRGRIRRACQAIKYFSLSAVILFLLAIVLFSLKITSSWNLYQQAILGEINLEKAITLAKEDKLNEAKTLAKMSENNFELSLDYLNAIKDDKYLNKFSIILNQLNNVESVLISAQFLSKAVAGGANFGLGLESILGGDKKLNFSKFTPEEKHKILSKIYVSGPELNGIKADLDLAFLSLEQVEFKGPLFIFKDKAGEIKNQLNEARRILAQAVPLSQLIPALAGYPKGARYLIMLQNNDELRPTGGFLGTYGVMDLKDGEITNLLTRDIYHLDMPVKDKVNVEPPEPIKKYLVPKWYLRDANWSPDWPSSARQIEWFYQLESGLNPQAEAVFEFDGVIALTPDLIMDFLEITGPITIEGQVYNKSNFQDLLQYRVEKGYEKIGVSSWQRKEVIGEIAKEIKIRIFNLPPADWSKATRVVLNNLAKKNLLWYLNDSQLEEIVITNGWGGEVKRVGGDFIMAVDANLAALKTDAVMERSLDYKLSQGVNGLFSKLTLGYSHQSKPDWKTSAYKSYTRVYVPQGSELIKMSGYKTSEVDSGSELGKTWFGFYLTVDPGKIKNVVIEYKLPERVIADNNYELYLEKQPGKEVKQARVDLSFLNNIKSYNPASLSMIKSALNKIEWKGDLSIDRSFEVKF